MNYLAAIFLSHRFETCVNNLVDNWWQMGYLLLTVFAMHPLLNFKIPWPVQWNWVIIEEIWHHDEVSVLGKLVCDKLCIYEAMTYHIRETVPMSLARYRFPHLRTHIKTPLSVFLFSGYLM